MPKVKTITLYCYDELSEKAKEEARNWYSEASSQDDWWRNTYDDAKQVGLLCKGFEMTSASYVYGLHIEFIEGGNSTLELIYQNHGKDCDTYKAAKRFEEKVDSIPELPEPESPAYHLMERESCSLFDAYEGEFLDDLRKCYEKMLQQEYEYQWDKENVEETIRANEYTFTETGKRED